MTTPHYAKSVLLLRPHELKDVIDIREAIDLVEMGYGEASLFPTINAPRRRIHSRKNVRVSNFPGGVDGLGVVGSLTRTEKISHDPSHQQIPYMEHPIYLLWDSNTGRLQAIIVGEIPDKNVGHISSMALRTAATSGLGFRYLARKNSTVAGVFGTGGQAVHKVLALQNERRIRSYKIYSRNPENRKAFCERLRKLADAEFIPVDDPRQVVKGSDVVICATNSNVPVFDGNWLEPGQHVVTVVGSNSALVSGGWLKSGRRENDDATVVRADVIVVNWRESLEQEQQAGLMDPLRAGLIGWDKIHELGEMASGSFLGRTSDEQITYHANTNGTAAADLAIAKRVYEHCKQLGRGMTIELPA